jgi:hypothetical protein
MRAILLSCLCLVVAGCGSSGSGGAPGTGGAGIGGTGSGGAGTGGLGGSAGAAGAPAEASCGTGTTGWVDTISTVGAPVSGGRAAYTGTTLMVIGGMAFRKTASSGPERAWWWPARRA